MTAKHQEKVPHIAILFCQYALHPDASVSDAARGVGGFSVYTEMIPCSSKITVGSLVEMFEHDVDGVEIVACPTKECQLLVGTRRAKKRVAEAQRILEASGQGAERLGISFAENLSATAVMDLAKKRADSVSALLIEGGAKKKARAPVAEAPSAQLEDLPPSGLATAEGAAELPATGV